ncbi:hypothetical protein G6M50_01415 [Agrobacterium rhizogenes]|nr:hypothetical protein [Rhizobium rhizogenes]NTJ76450.1 hypothetical protein [Rhizobium rhizogenes]
MEISEQNILRDTDWTVQEVIFAVLAGAWVLLLHGAVPFLMTPTLGQAIWASGFAQSLANRGWLNIYAHDFGIPLPAAIAFGLSGALPMSWLIRLGLHPADAYAGVFALWLMIAFCSAYLICRSLGMVRALSILAAIAWMGMPIIWAHANYSMLSLGIGLLPFYFLAALRLFRLEMAVNRVSAASFYFLAALISIFMDGYTFVMFAVGSSILLGYSLLSEGRKRRDLLTKALPVHIASFLLAYIAFAAYIGRYSYEQSPIDFFRGWGLDLSFALVPTKGMYWLLDKSGLSVARSDELYFGDASVWKTTFALPTIAIALWAWWRARKRRNLSMCFMIVALIAFYMALGPSLKIDSVKPAEIRTAQPGQQSAQMPAQLAIAPTGNAWISETLPGFKSMRASYRWSALGIFALWMVIVICSASSDKRYKLPAVALTLIVLLNIPNLPERFRSLADNRMQFLQIETDLVEKLRQAVKQNETVAFVPWQNDFIVNYLAPKIGFRAFNIGGDKNLTDAQTQWPSDMQALGGQLDDSKISHIVRLLAMQKTDAVIVPYLHTLWSAHLWPCLDQTQAKITESLREEWSDIPDFYCPDQRKAALHPTIQKIEASPYLSVSDSDLFAAIRLRPEYQTESGHNLLLKTILSHTSFPIEFGTALQDIGFILSEGWNAPEADHVWSQSVAKLVLPVPNGCDARKCLATLHFNIFGASPQRPVTVELESRIKSGDWQKTMTVTKQDDNELSVPLSAERTYQEIEIRIPDATSPAILMGTTDDRTLGMALIRADLTFAD